MAIDSTYKLERPRGRVWLAAVNGISLARMEGRAANGEQRKQLTDAEAEDQIIATLAEFEGRLDPAGDFRLDVVTLRGELEQRRALRRP